ncbi:MAG: hypothetical protein GY711_20180 [bacterium]|nr:hypothetical protein [bacterium]
MELHEKYPSAARNEVRATLFPMILMVGIAGAFFIGDGLFNQVGPQRFGECFAGTMLILVARGLYMVRQWARWTAVLTLGGISLAGLIAGLVSGTLLGPDGIVKIGVGLVFWGATWLYLATAGDTFALANTEWEPRSAKARAEREPRLSQEEQG